MKDTILLELARRWDAEAKEPQAVNGSPEAVEGNAVARGERQAKRECADTLRSLVSMLGETL